jgi:hypothetical protein
MQKADKREAWASKTRSGRRMRRMQTGNIMKSLTGGFSDTPLNDFRELRSNEGASSASRRRKGAVYADGNASYDDEMSIEAGSAAEERKEEDFAEFEHRNDRSNGGSDEFTDPRSTDLRRRRSSTD